MTTKGRSCTRIGLAGGGSDIPEFFKENGGAVLNVGINIYSYTSMEPLFGCKYTEVISHDWGFSRKITNLDLEFNTNKKNNVDVVKAVMKHCGLNPKDGYRFIISSAAAKNSGLAGSSALLTSIMGSIYLYSNKPIINRARLARDAIHIEREVLNRYGGNQDQWASVFGGFNFIEFSKNETTICPLRFENDLLCELHSSMLLFELPKSRKVSASIIEKKKIDNMKDNTENLIEIKECAYAMRHNIIRGDIEALGQILECNWEAKKKMDSVSNKEIDYFHNVGITAGAFGGKLCGAGGGGNMFFICPLENRKNIISEMTKIGCKQLNFDFDQMGLVAWRTD
jgi:D-glycero-alpha-D-manno-heptose-7-phosphate kinase